MAYFSSRNPNKTFSTQLAIGISLIIGVFFQSLLNFFSFEIYGSSIPITLMILIYWNIALPKNIGLSWSYFRDSIRFEPGIFFRNSCNFIFIYFLLNSEIFSSD